MKSRKTHRREVYVWELPVRFYHWINAACILVLCITGFIIADPPAFVISNEAYFNYWFGTVRFIHFVAAFVFFFNFVFRLYWGFVGNTFSRWYNYIPYTKRQWKEIWQVIRIDVLQVNGRPVYSIGHNALANLIYFSTFLAFLVQCFTGFGLYAKMSQAAFPHLFSWVVPILGGDMVTREIHHFLMWFFILFTMVHIYLVFYHDYIERRGVTSSIIGGWKFIEEEIAEEEEKIQIQAFNKNREKLEEKIEEEKMKQEIRAERNDLV